MSDNMNLNRVEAEYQEIINKNGWMEVYKRLGEECKMYHEYSFTEAAKKENKHLNRYRDVSPYDHSLIMLHRLDRQYINANLVKMDRANRKYILTQGPLATTVSHFWLMIWEQDSRAILMLNKIIEKNEVKCHWYWPQGTGDRYKMELTDVQLTIEQVSTKDYDYYDMRVFKVFDAVTSETREIVQFHYTTWPDFGVPKSPVEFVEFLRKVRASGALNADVGPPVVHCSAGIGRSGTFCLVDICLVIIEKEDYKHLNIQEVLMQLRRDRMGLIQTPDQLRFSYQAIIEGAKRLDDNWEARMLEESLYSNVADDSDDDTPPPPPPRGASLMAPARPLPALPSASRAINYALEESSSDESPPTSPERESSSASSADDEDEEPILPPPVESGSGESAETLRRRRQVAQLAERVSAMKRRAHDAEQWHSIKRLKSEEDMNTEPRED